MGEEGTGKGDILITAVYCLTSLYRVVTRARALGSSAGPRRFSRAGSGAGAARPEANAPASAKRVRNCISKDC